MPSGKVHNDINQTIFIGSVIAALFFMPNLTRVGWFRVLGFGISINYLNCDLDKNNTRPDQNWGRWGWIWNIYAFFMPHRGNSHAWWGFLTRYAFIIIVVSVSYFLYNLVNLFYDYGTIEKVNVIYILSDYWTALKSLLHTRNDIILSITEGIIVGDLLHIIEDAILK